MKVTQIIFVICLWILFLQASGERMNADDCNGRSYAQGTFIYIKKRQLICVLSPAFNVYFNNMDIFVFQVMEESHQLNRTFMASCRALLQDLQTVSSPHHTAPLVVSCFLFVALSPYGLVEYSVCIMYGNKCVLLYSRSTKQTPSRLSCAVMMSHQVAHGQRTKSQWGPTVGRMTEGTQWKKGMQNLLGREETERAFTMRWLLLIPPHRDLSGCPMGSCSVRFVEWSALDPMCWWSTSVATRVRTSQQKQRSWLKEIVTP